MEFSAKSESICAARCKKADAFIKPYARDIFCSFAESVKEKKQASKPIVARHHFNAHIANSNAKSCGKHVGGPCIKKQNYYFPNISPEKKPENVEKRGGKQPAIHKSGKKKNAHQ